MQLSAPENLLKVANSVMTDASSGTDKRAIVLFLIIMSAAGNFFESFRWDKQQMWEGSRLFLRDTNLDMITAEAIIWITFLIGEFWKADQKKDHEMFERVGFGVLTLPRLPNDLRPLLAKLRPDAFSL